MTSEEMVPDLELCERLKELGWERETYFIWAGFKSKVADLPEQVDVKPVFLFEEFCGPCDRIAAPAPTVSEMLDILPDAIFIDDYTYTFKMGHSHASYSHSQNFDRSDWKRLIAVDDDPNCDGSQDRIQNILSRLIIWLVGNGHLKLEKK